MVDTEAFYCKEQSSCLEINRPNNRFEMPVCGWGAVFFCLLYDVSLHRKPFKWQLFFLDQLQEISETTARERCNKEARTNTQMCHLLFLSGTSDAISPWPPPKKKKKTQIHKHTLTNSHTHTHTHTNPHIHKRHQSQPWRQDINSRKSQKITMHECKKAWSGVINTASYANFINAELQSHYANETFVKPLDKYSELQPRTGFLSLSLLSSLSSLLLSLSLSSLSLCLSLQTLYFFPRHRECITSMLSYFELGKSFFYILMEVYILAVRRWWPGIRN